MIGADLLALDAAELSDLVRDGRARAEPVVEASLAVIARGQSAGDRIFVAAHTGARGAFAAAARIGGGVADTRKHARQRGGGPLAGLPVAVADDIADLALPTTAGSRALAGYVSPFEATAVARLLAAGAVVVGKTNMDEFGLGWSTEFSSYGAARNPAAPDRTPGGAAGGAAAAVASGAVRIALATDTAGAVRQAAAGCGVVGVRPTYGRVSRSGVVACASSLDQVGVLGRTVADAALALEVVGGRDPRDPTSADLEMPALRLPPGPVRDGRPLKGVRVGRPREYFDAIADSGIRERADAVLALARDLGADVKDVSLRHAALASPACVAITAAEVSSNLARIDGVRFGPRAGAPNARTVYETSRAEGFGPEVVRRLVLGTHLLSDPDGEQLHRRALDARAKVAHDYGRLLDDVDLLVTPTTPLPAFAVGSAAADLAAAHAYDGCTAAASLAGLPAMSIPIGRVSGCPVGAQLVGRHFGEALLFRAAAALERALGAEAHA